MRNDGVSVKDLMLKYSEFDAQESVNITSHEMSIIGDNRVAKGVMEDIKYIHKQYTLKGAVPSDHSVF